MPVIKILKNDVFYALSGLNPQKAYVLKNCASVLTPAWSNSTVFACQQLPFLPVGSMPTYNLCLRRVPALTPLTTVPLLYFLVFLKLLKQSFTSGFSSIYLVSTFSLIVSMVSVRSALLAIFLLSLLIPGHPLLVVPVKLSLLP